MTERGVKASLPRTFRALAHRNFRLFFTGQGLSLIGTWLQQVAMGWLTYRLTNSAWLLGVVAFCANVGILLFSNVAGVLADRIDRRRGLLVTQSLMLTQAIVLAVLVAFGWIQTEVEAAQVCIGAPDVDDRCVCGDASIFDAGIAAQLLDPLARGLTPLNQLTSPLIEPRDTLTLGLAITLNESR